MKILFISRMFPSEYNSKDGRVILSLAKELKKKGHHITVISPRQHVPFFLANRNEYWYSYKNTPEKYSIDNIDVIKPKYFKFPKNLFKKITNIFFKRSLLKSINDNINLNEIDIIHFHMIYPDSSIITELPEKLNKVITIRETDFQKHMTNDYISKEMRNSLEKADGLISPSYILKNKLNKYWSKESKHIGNGIYPENINNGDYKVSFDLISVSNLIKTKGIEDNIRAVKHLVKIWPDFKYIIVGDGPEHNQLVKLVNLLKLNKNIIFTGLKKHNEVINLISQSKIFSLPSYKETFGLVYLEAMYLKVPVILCKNHSLDGIVEDNYNGKLVKEKDALDIANAIEELMKNHDLYNKIRFNGYKTVEKYYTWEKIGVNLEDYYTEIINRG